MCDEWMPRIELAMSIEQFHQLPRNAGYKYEYIDGRALLSPRPKHYHAMLDLVPMSPEENVPLRPVRETDWPDLERLFSGAFRTIQPFGSLDDESRLLAARQSLERTRTGGDGPWIEKASFVAVSREDERPIGAILITLLPEGDPCDWDSYYWREPPPADCIEQKIGRPHLTWIFVSGWQAGEGVGTALLAAAVRELMLLGYRELASTFMLGNDSSTLWHWRNGFRLLAHPGSRREMYRRWRRHSS